MAMRIWRTDGIDETTGDLLFLVVDAEEQPSMRMRKL